MKDANKKAAKRLIAESCLRLALEQIDETQEVGRARAATYTAEDRYKTAGALAQHAADQIRLGESD